MSDSSSSADHAGNEEGETRTRTEYGADWVGIDTKSMRARVASQRQRAREQEAARLRQEQEELQSLLKDDAEVQPKPISSAAVAKNPTRGDMPLSTPKALIERLRVENLRAFGGSHDIPLAPLTLVYGPNSAGKSTILKALKLFRDVVDAGRSDAIHAWAEAFRESSARTLMTYSAPDPDDPSGFQWRSPLALGVDFRTREGQIARAELEYDLNPVGSVDSHSTALGFIDEKALTRKSFVPQDFVDDNAPFHPGDFGLAPLRRFVVETSLGNKISSREIVSVDAELFGHADERMQADLFELVYFLRYIGPNRGEPGHEYLAQDGIFNSSWLDYFRKPRVGGHDEMDLLNQMLAQLEIPYVFEQDPSGKLRAPTKSKWIMRDVRSGVPVALDQVGYGVSQLLPIVDLCVHAQGQLICIEEPELHLHPRLQARLGNLFATAVVSRGNQVVVETHSESILLRVRRLIRGGKLRPEDVAVIYVDNNASSGATVRRLGLGVQGELLDPWPSGFFDDSLADILDITS